MLLRLGLFLLSFVVLQDCTYSLRLLEVRIPEYVVKGSAAQLECLYELDGEALYSVKWYKDGNEFYRYVPRDMPPAQTFLLPGVAVDLHNSSDAIVTLKTVNLQSTGRFRCEVSGEAPSFQTVTEHGDMVVVSLPDQGAPSMTGGRPRYTFGDWVRINCTAGHSKPGVELSWYVNGNLADPHSTRKYENTLHGRDGLESATLGLQFRVEQNLCRNGDMKVKCVAQLSSFYWRSNEESVECDRPQKAPVLESRETVYASNSRADPVQAGNGTDSLVVAHAPSWLLLLLVAAAVITTAASDFDSVAGLHFASWQQQQQQQHQTEMAENQLSQANNEKSKSEMSKNIIASEEQQQQQQQQETLAKMSNQSNQSTASISAGCKIVDIVVASSVAPQVATLKSLAAR